MTPRSASDAGEARVTADRDLGALIAAGEAVLRRRATRAGVWAEVGPEPRRRLGRLVDVLVAGLGSDEGRSTVPWGDVREDGATWAREGTTERGASELLHAAAQVVRRRLVWPSLEAPGSDMSRVEAFSDLVQDVWTALAEGVRQGAEDAPAPEPRSLLQKLLEEPLGSEVVAARRLSEARVDTRPPFALFVLTDRQVDAPVDPVEERAARVGRALPDRPEGPILPSRRPDGFDFVVLVVPGASPEALGRAISAMEAGCEREHLVAVYAVADALGDVYPTNVRLRDAATVSAAVAHRTGVVAPLEALLPYREALGLDPVEQVAQVEATTAPLIKGKVERGLKRLQILRVLKRKRRSVLTEAARELNMHVNTLRMWIHEIEKATKLDVIFDAERFDRGLTILELWGEDEPHPESPWWAEASDEA